MSEDLYDVGYRAGAADAEGYGFELGMVVGAALIAWASVLQLRFYCRCSEAWTHCRVHDPDLREPEAYAGRVVT